MPKSGAGTHPVADPKIQPADIALIPGSAIISVDGSDLCSQAEEVQNLTFLPLLLQGSETMANTKGAIRAHSDEIAIDATPAAR